MPWLTWPVLPVYSTSAKTLSKRVRGETSTGNYRLPENWFRRDREFMVLFRLILLVIAVSLSGYAVIAFREAGKGDYYHLILFPVMAVSYALAILKSRKYLANTRNAVGSYFDFDYPAAVENIREILSSNSIEFSFEEIETKRYYHGWYAVFSMRLSGYDASLTIIENKYGIHEITIKPFTTATAPAVMQLCMEMESRLRGNA